MKQLNKLEMVRKDTEPKVIKSIENTDSVCNERPTQFTASKVLNKKEHHNKNTKSHHKKIRMDWQKSG